MKIIKQHVISPLKRGEVVWVKPSRSSRLVRCVVAACVDEDGGCHNCVLDGRPGGCSPYWYYLSSKDGHDLGSAKFIPIEDVVE